MWRIRDIRGKPERFRFRHALDSFRDELKERIEVQKAIMYEIVNGGRSSIREEEV